MRTVLLLWMIIGLVSSLPVAAQPDKGGSQAEQTSPLTMEKPAADSQKLLKKFYTADDSSLSESPDDVGQVLEEAARKPQPLVKFGPLKPLGDAWDSLNKKLIRKIGLSLGLSYTTLYQHAEQYPNSRNAAGSNFQFLGTWQLVDRRGNHPGILGFKTESQHYFTTGAPDYLDQRLGTLWPTSESFGQQRYALVELWWEQHLAKDLLTVRFGKIEPKDFFDVFRYENFTTGFLNAAFTQNPAIGFPDEGLGFGVGLSPWKWFYLNVGLSDANSKNTTSGLSTFFNRGEFFYAVELGVTPRFPCLGQGAYKVTFWQADAASKAGKPRGRGFSMTLEQELGCSLVPFCRYSFADGEATDLRQLAFGGFGLEKPFRRKDDLIGLGFAWGQPSNRSLPDQYVLEAFYRVQVFPYLQVTPDLQVIFNPSQNPDKSTIMVLGLRTRALF